MDIYCDGYCVFTSILYDVQLGSEQSSCIMIESIIIFIVLNILSKALKNRIGSGDFDIACIICLSIGHAGMF